METVLGVLVAKRIELNPVDLEDSSHVNLTCIVCLGDHSEIVPSPEFEDPVYSLDPNSLSSEMAFAKPFRGRKYL